MAPKPQQPVTATTLREILRDELNDRFDHYEKRQTSLHREMEKRHEKQHQEMLQGFAEIIETVNDHTTAEIAKLRTDLGIRQEFDHLTTVLAKKLNLSVAELVGRA